LDVIWTPSGTNFADIWAPELHFINGRWYVYFAADQNGDNSTHRIYVLESKSADPLSKYSFVGEINAPDNQWAIDGTVLNLNNHLYFIWSGWENPNNQTTQNLYIAPMSSPTQISGQRILISSPTYSWENSVAPINEGPEILQHDGKTFLIYSANASWTNSYCLGMLTLVGSNPLKPSSWVKNPTPVFQSGNGVYGPGHSSFTTSEDGTQNWIVYHAARYSGAGWDRTIRTQPFTWNANGSPNFGQPLPTSTQFSLPSGEKPSTLQYEPTSSSSNDTSFTVNVDKTGFYNLLVRYENGSTTSVLGNVSVNGREQNTISYPRTGGSDQWSTLSDRVYLRHGENTIQFVHKNGVVGIDYIEVPLKGESPSYGSVVTYEAENNIYFDASVVSEYNASNGEVVGHIDYPDSYVKFNNVYVPHDGNYTITVRYDNGMSDCTDNVSVNGGTIFPLLLPSTGAWNTFKTVTFEARLNAGLNSIQFGHGSNYAQIDYIQVPRKSSDK
jgi:GH43 family beta-xylosidase